MQMENTTFVAMGYVVLLEVESSTGHLCSYFRKCAVGTDEYITLGLLSICKCQFAVKIDVVDPVLEMKLDIWSFFSG